MKYSGQDSFYKITQQKYVVFSKEICYIRSE